MATIAEMLFASASESAQKGPDLAGNLAKGAELGIHMQKVKNDRLQLEQTKAEHSLQKYSKITDLIKIAHESKDPAIADSMWKHAIPSAARALDAEDVFTPEFLETAAKSPETREKVLGFQLEIEQRIADGETAKSAAESVLATISDPAVRAAMDTDRIIKAQAIEKGERELEKRAKIAADAAMAKQKQGQDAAPLVDVEKKVRDDHRKFMIDGGLAKANSRIQKLKEAEAFFKEQMDQGEKPTGTFAAGAAQRLGLQGLKNPKLKANMDKLRNSIALKGSLDSQFSAKEAEQQYAQQTADADLPVENAYERAKALREEAEAALRNATGTFKQYGLNLGTEKGPKIPADKINEFKKLSKPMQEKALKGLIQMFGENVKKDLGL